MDNKVLDKIKKLLRLAKSDNEHEAANAAAAASRLMVQHQISAVMVDGNDDTTDAVLGTFTVDGSSKRKVPWKADLAFGVAASYGCKYFYSGPNIMMVGRESDVDAVRYTYKYLVREVNRLATEHWEAYPYAKWEKAKLYKSAFRTGASLTIRKRLHMEREDSLAREAREAEKDTATSQAIVRVMESDSKVDDYFQNLQKDGKFGNFKRKSSIGSIDGLNDGKRAGANVRIGGEQGFLGGTGNSLDKGTTELND